MSLTQPKGFISERCIKAMKRIVEPDEELLFYVQMELVKSFCYLEDRLNASGGSEAAVIARTTTGRIKFRDCRELLHGI